MHRITFNAYSPADFAYLSGSANPEDSDERSSMKDLFEDSDESDESDDSDDSDDEIENDNND